MAGWNQEVYYSMLQAAGCRWKLDGTFPVDAYLRAYNYRPSRSEAIYEVVRYYRLDKQYHLSYMLGKVGVEIPPTKDALFVQKDIEEWRMTDELAISAYWIGEYKESIDLCDKLLSNGKLPEREVERVKLNKRYAVRELAKQ